MVKKTFYTKFLLLLLVSIFLAPLSARAETHISEDLPDDINYWNESGSPYILDQTVGLYAPRKLIIGPGVVVMSASTTDGQDPNYLWSSGDIEINGTKDTPVHIIGLGNMSLGMNNKIENTFFENTGLYSNYGTTTIASSVISGASTAIFAKKSTIDIEDSTISDNDEGIFSAIFTNGPSMAISGDMSDTGGIGNALGDDPVQNHITIHNSSLVNNKSFSIKNMVSNPIDATNNWWGSSNGPETAVSGPVLTDPWKKESQPKVVCCSNVLFLPGLETSRLYRDDKDLLGGGTTTHRAWEPFASNDVRSLFLNKTGSSTNSTIHTTDILDSAYGFVDIYKKFIAMMDGVVADGTINSWLPFAYDWRMSPDDVVMGNTLYSTTTKRLIDEVQKLAETSKTGKVTIIAHSNGGLVAKMLGYELEKIGMAGLIDKVILVAVPQLGTPEAIAGMLHGVDQELLGGVILKSGIARAFGLNMSGAYGLLPSQEYFSRVVEPVVTFAGQAVGSYTGFTNFLTGKNDKRSQPKESDLKTPAVLSQSLLTKADWMHSIIDTWEFPTTTDVVSIAGWGIPTIASLGYSSSSPTIRKSPAGDGTVVTASANGYPVQADEHSLYFNQGLYDHNEKKNVEHADIMGASPISSLISKALATSSLASLLDSFSSNYLSPKLPNADDYPWMKWLTVSVHSPVDMDIYDSHGGHMGLVPLPNSSSTDVMYLENTIGGQYEAVGDEKYYTIPADDTYVVKLKGTGVGNFTFQVQKFVGSDMTEVSNIVYADLPVTPLLVASTTLSATTIDSPLNLDVDGDGTTDFHVNPSPTANPILHLEAMKTIILSLHLKQNLEKSLLQKLESARVLVLKDKKGKIIDKIHDDSDLDDEDHMRFKNLTDPDRQLISSDLEHRIDDLLGGN